MKNEIKKVKLYVQAVKWAWDDKFAVQVNSFRADSLDNRMVVELSEVEIEIEVPLINEKQLQMEEIKHLQSIIEKEKADSYVRVTAIEEKIQSLLSLEHTS